MSNSRKQSRRGFRMTFRKAVLAIVSLAALVFAAQQSSANTDMRAARVTRTGDGMAKITFQPVTSDDRVNIYSKQGELLGRLNWNASFELSVTEAALRKATTAKGINIRALLDGIGGSIQANSLTLVGAELPYSVQDLDGREIPKGTQVYFGLEGLAKSGSVAPVGAWGGDSMGPGGAVNEFNDRLLTSGVEGEKKSAAPKPSKGAAKPAAQKHVHGAGAENVPLDESDVRDILNPGDDRFLTSPTCVDRSGDSLRTSSYWGRRKSFRTSNGHRASSWHDGLDIAGKMGTPIVAAADGCMTVRQMRFNKNAGYGLSIQLDHAKGLQTQYSHMQKFSDEIRAWAKTAKKNDKYCVARGQLIGYIGRTGNSTGPHLHFGVRQNGKSVDPRKHLRAESNADLSNSCRDLAAQIERLKPVTSSMSESSTPASAAPAARAAGAPTAR